MILLVGVDFFCFFELRLGLGLDWGLGTLGVSREGKEVELGLWRDYWRGMEKGNWVLEGMWDVGRQMDIDTNYEGGW